MQHDLNVHLLLNTIYHKFFQIFRFSIFHFSFFNLHFQQLMLSTEIELYVIYKHY